MENAAKALLIAGGILIGLIIISLMLYGHSQISNYYETKEQEKETGQLAEFNKQYIPYNRDNVRGSDLLSLVNRIIDYNEPKMNDINEEKINISIFIDDIQNFYYKYAENKNVKLIQSGTTYTQDNLNSKLISPANQIEIKYTQALATKLSANITTLMGDNSRKEPNDLFAELKVNASSYGGLATIRQDILLYYQYQQFKRAHFNCENLTYKDGRVKSFTFRFNGTFE